jgi:hypothetical protein
MGRMQYLRMLTNALAAGALGAAYVVVLVLQLNPQVPLGAPGLWRWVATLGVFYGVHLTVAAYALIVLRELAGRRPLLPGWLSVRVLAWLGAAAAGAAAVLMWTNVRGFATSLDPDAARRMAMGAAATSVAAAVLFAVAVARSWLGRSSGPVTTAWLVLAVAGSLALPLAARGAGRPTAPATRGLAPSLRAAPLETGPRVVLVLLDGASLGYLWARVSQGLFPHFGRLLDTGAIVDLATLRPTQAEPVWAAVATGKYPPQNGIRSAGLYRVARDGLAIDLLPDRCYAFGLVRVGLVEREAHTATAFRAAPIWQILSEAGVPVGIVRWPVTTPAAPVFGFLVSDRFHLAVDSPIPGEVEATVSPPPLVPLLRQAARVPDAETPSIVPPDAPGAAGAHDTPAAQAERLDRLYGRVAEAADRATRVRLLAVRYQGLDTVGHWYLRYAEPARFGDVTTAAHARYGAVLDAYYGFLDGELGRLIGRLGPEDLLLVVSGFGMEPVSLGRRVLARLLGEAEVSGTHEEAPDGFLLAYGAHVARGRPARGSVADIAPTVLYYLGLPVGRDMDGFARTDLFTRTFRAAHPIAFIPSHDR